MGNITRTNAFHMILLQFFAKNEEWMIENGVLQNGELYIFTISSIDKVTTIFSSITNIIF